MDILVIGTGEYVTGVTGGTASTSDKAIGVVGICLFHLRTRGKVGRILLVGRSGMRFPTIRQHFTDHMALVYRNLDVEMETWPEDHEYDETACRQSLASLEPGNAVIVVTPDDTHFSVALEAIDAARAITEGRATLEDFDGSLPTAAGALQGTAILEAGRRSLDNDNLPVTFLYESQQSLTPIGMEINDRSAVAARPRRRGSESGD
uniref:Uncharacterized protein n=1 Tax=Candidatus Kentrum sp. FW TaxID=2126338 RepID=A0A450TMI6_9GAMM|nr:MAG: hypothetical protein BECKFW1821A_GA0114235_11455 [Candidatus Kentron sp. FW]VFJ68945.1 MAG: hypothetical protein BECKFW1821B_GA0114236_11565 [Candidatus Kentron sp. FW]